MADQRVTTMMGNKLATSTLKESAIHDFSRVCGRTAPPYSEAG